MRHFVALLGCFLTATAFSALAYADGLVRRLPEEGQWARYRMSEHWEDGTERQIDITLRSLGSEAISGRLCSWLEITFETPDKSTRLAFRFLTPDEYLVTGTDPLGEAVEVWTRKNDGEFHRDNAWAGFLPRLDLVSPASLKNPIELPDTESLSLAGKELECQVVTGTHTRKFARTATIAQYRLALNDDVPFGVAAATIDATTVSNCDPDPTAECNFTRGMIELTLTSMGENAGVAVPRPQEVNEASADTSSSGKPVEQ